MACSPDAPESRHHKKKVAWGEPSQKRDDVSGGGLINHKTLWARDKSGLHNLFRLSSRAYNGIRVGPGRGSAAGSLAAYALGITDLDPLPHGLIFERFLNPERVSMPNVDIDFDERRRMGITVLPPDVNESDADFTPRGDTEIRFGLSAIRNVGGNVVEGIVAARREKSRYTDFNDFLRKVPPVVCNKRVVESLIKAGACDDLKHERKGLVIVHEQAIDAVIDLKQLLGPACLS